MLLLHVEYESDACANYTLLVSEHRSASFNITDVQKCDNRLAPGWYRFSRAAGEQMADHCVRKLHCGTYAPGWLKGNHPAVDDGEVQRQVCFHSEGECCKNSKFILVKNCGHFYVYKLSPTPFCPSRYCGAKIRSPIISTGLGSFIVCFFFVWTPILKESFINTLIDTSSILIIVHAIV